MNLKKIIGESIGDTGKLASEILKKLDSIDDTLKRLEARKDLRWKDEESL